MDNAIGLGIVLSLRDQASAGLAAVRNKLTALRDISQDMIKQFDAGAKQMITGFASMVAGSKVLGTITKMFGASVDTAAEFEQAMARVGAVSGATGEDLEALSKQARDLGRDTQFSASQAAASQENLARAGFQTNEIIAAMPGLLNMAAAEGMDLANAADIASSAIRGFGLDASEANRVADVLAKTSSASNTSIALLGESLKYVAPLAKGLGISIEQTNAMLGVMANAGIKGSQAGTALKSALQRLSEEPKRVSKALASIGVKAKTAEGDLRPIPELMKDIAAKTQGMGKGDKIGILSKIFGGVASSGMLAIMDGVANGSLPELEAALYGCSGAAQQMAERMNATAKGAMLRLESASEGLRIVIGNHLIPAYTWLIDTIASFKSWLAQLIEAHPVISKAVIGFTTALIGLAGSALLVVGALSSIGGLIKMWPLLKGAAVLALTSIRAQAIAAVSSFSKLRIAMNAWRVPVVGMIALAAELFYAWRKNLWGIRDTVEAVVQGFRMAWSASTEGLAEVDDALADKLQKAGVWDFAVSMGKVFFRVRTFWNGLLEGFKEGVDFFMNAVGWVKEIFAPVVESGQELLKFLGILQPVADTQVDTWKAWGKLFGRLAPAIIAVIAAFKGIRIVKGIFGDVGKAILLMFNVITAHPIGALIAGLVALGIYLYTHWDEVAEFFSQKWAKIKEWGSATADWLQEKWQGFLDWWNNLTLSDIFASIYDGAVWICEKVKQPFIDLKNWVLSLFANLNPFNWQMPSWLGGGRPTPSPQVLQAQQTAMKSSPQGQNASSIADRFAKAYTVKSPESNALGNIITHRTLSWVGENGPEAIIPLNDRQRSVALWLQTGREIGMLPNSTVFNSMSSQQGKQQTFSSKSLQNVLNSLNINSQSHRDKRQNIYDTATSFMNNSQNNSSMGILRLPAVERSMSFMSKSQNNSNTEILRLPPIERSTATFTRNLLNSLSVDRTNNLASDSVQTLSSKRTNNLVSERTSSLSSGYSELVRNNSVLREVSPLMNSISVFPHAMGGIFSQPHLGLVAEAGTEAVIPLENKSRGLPLLIAAASELIGPEHTKLVERYTNQPQTLNHQTEQPYSLPLLSQQFMNQTSINEQHSSQLHEHSAMQNNKVEVHADVKPADIYIDGERVGRIAFRWIEHQSIRNGAGS